MIVPCCSEVFLHCQTSVAIGHSPGPSILCLLGSRYSWIPCETSFLCDPCCRTSNSAHQPNQAAFMFTIGALSSSCLWSHLLVFYVPRLAPSLHCFSLHVSQAGQPECERLALSGSCFQTPHTCTELRVLVVASWAVGHLVIESALAAHIRGGKVVLPAALRWAQGSSYRVVSRFLRRLDGQVAGRSDHARRWWWWRGHQVMTSFSVARHVSLLAINRLPRFFALWRTQGRLEDSLLSNIRLGLNLVARASSPSS